MVLLDDCVDLGIDEHSSLSGALSRCAGTGCCTPRGDAKTVCQGERVAIEGQS